MMEMTFRNRPLNFIQKKEVACHPEGFEGWKRDQEERITRNKDAREAWIEKTVKDLFE